MSDRSKQPVVSVILITYKKFDRIYESLDSIFAQTYPCIELILQDDASPNFEKYRERIEAYIQSHKRENIQKVIINHLSENMGTSKNVNAGIRLATGKYIKLTTADDSFYGEKMIARCVALAEEKQVRIIVGQSFVQRRDGGPDNEVKDTIGYRWSARSGRKCVLTPSNHDIEYLKSLSMKKCNELLASRCIISTVSVFYRRDIFQETGGFLEDYRLVEDMPFWPYLAKRGERFCFSHIIMMRYRLDGISNGGTLNSQFHQDYCDIMKSIYIANEVRGGIFNKTFKHFREKEIDWIDVKRQAPGIKEKLRYLDVRIYQLWHNIKYLLTGSKL